jgi:BirA family biotin operon repressor/biotin-[acetyl-CoA-carboxylase] ligase
MGTTWNTEASKNLTFSVFKDVSFLSVEQQFYISMVVALAIVKGLNDFKIPRITIKWPNDILAETKKIAGVLIENVVKNNTLAGCIIGVGLNVNQKFFDNLPQASSLHALTGIIFSKDEILERILKHLELYFKTLEAGNFEAIKTEYETLLFRINKPSTFKTPENTLFSGFIEGVSEDGKLKILLEDTVTAYFDLKQVRLLY